VAVKVAEVTAVRAMAAAVGGRLGVKAAGGIRTTSDALVMLPDSVLTPPIGFLARYRCQPITVI
jgi:deoxyribose-phosphate aldolase